MEANLFSWKSDGLNNRRKGVELKCVYAYALPYHLYHTGIFLRSVVAVCLKVFDCAAFEFLYTTARDELHIGFTCAEV